MAARHLLPAPCIALIGLAIVTGCSSPDGQQASPAKPRNQISGTVGYGGLPVWEGRITLLGEDERIATGLLEKDGTFTLVNPPRGKVRVAVSNYPANIGAPPIETDQPGVAQCVMPDRVFVQLPDRLADPATSPWIEGIAADQDYLELQVPRESHDPLPVKRPQMVVGANIGQAAPEIVGDDLHGDPLRLSEFRGKVVALVFWAHWCNLCRAEIPHYQALARRMKDRPFVLLGVNCDPDREILEQQTAQLDIPWRSWWDGASIGGPVSAAYQFQGFPAVMLIDDKGTIRYRNLRGDALDRAVDELVASLGPHK